MSPFFMRATQFAKRHKCAYVLTVAFSARIEAWASWFMVLKESNSAKFDTREKKQTTT